VLDELAGWHQHYATEVGQKLVREMVTRDVNHPCILFLGQRQRRRLEHGA